MKLMNDNYPAASGVGKPATATRLALLCAALFFSTCLEIRAVGFRDPNQDPEGIARGNAFAATADNPSAIYYNPAGITQLEGFQFRVGLYLISPDTKYTSPSGAKAETDTSWQAIPQIYAVYSLPDLPISLGLGVYCPYGLSLDWGAKTPFRTAAENGKLLYTTFNPVIAWQIHPTLSIAVGPTINYSEATFEQGFSPFNPTDKFKVKGDDNALGFNAGLRWQPHKMLALGLNYRSATTMNYDGFSQTRPGGPFPYYPRTKTTASLQFPQFVAAGISVRPTENWNFEMDVDWTDWDNLNTIIFKGTPLGDIPFALNYRSSWMYEFGVTRQLGKGYYASVGYIYSENSSPDRNYSPLIPDANLQLGSIGFGHHGKRWDWAVGYHFAYNGGRKVSGDANPLADGTYKTFNNAVNASITFKM
jgi:long-chain fatty acid transport protein